MSDNNFSNNASKGSDMRSAKSIVDEFLDAIWTERGLSKNTQAAYRADLMALSRWLEPRSVRISDASRDDLLQFIAARVEKGARPRSTARQLSSFRRFFRYLVREARIDDDPTATIQMPKIGRTLPKSLSEGKVEDLLQAPDVDEP